MSATENPRKLPEKKWKKTSYRVDIDRKTKPIENKCLKLIDIAKFFFVHVDPNIPFVTNNQ
ncbi:hypothetical protein DERF_009945 [Dermatophagoides farinae]|uniref:Uncharacterized protein n=1 Tax=Dermatophagoides farinae TaxID=6954 RepID=A0A922HV15_DERFA|nr:hypothetical protein DERF_009945 [Dermatophagoides farinae]